MQRLLWALGYHVPKDSVVHFDREQLAVAPDATQKLKDGGEVPLDEAALDELLTEVAMAADGERYRGLASKLLDGKPLGGYPMTGTRADDPNDRVPHEHRRDVRAQWVFFAWLKHTDVKVANTLDMWVEDPEGSGPDDQNPTRGTVLLDEEVRSALRVDNRRGRRAARDMTDVMLAINTSYPFLIDSLAMAWVYRGSPEVAKQMALINMEVTVLNTALESLSAWRSPTADCHGGRPRSPAAEAATWLVTRPKEPAPTLPSAWAPGSSRGTRRTTPPIPSAPSHSGAPPR